MYAGGGRIADWLGTLQRRVRAWLASGHGEKPYLWQLRCTRITFRCYSYRHRQNKFYSVTFLLEAIRCEIIVDVDQQTYGRCDREKDDIRNRGIPQTSVYHSKDPKMFGIDQDEEYFIGYLQVAAPEIVLYEGQYYIFALKQGSLEGMRCAKLMWVEKEM